ncbi:MAG TPA: hypothetical protein VKZ18_20825 [Polyangia bacterium]|nr:hypothetical protein [Polyangia bacterium]
MRAAGLAVASVVVVLGGCKGLPLGGPRSVVSDASTNIAFLDASGPLFPPDASTGPVYGAACWESALPEPVQPTQPTSTVAEACAAGAAATASDWTYPLNSAGANGDDRRYLVGRWAVCDQSIFGLPAHAGLEFGANGRWRMLTVDADTGALVPMARAETTSGYYHLLGIGQLNLDGELPGDGNHSFIITFTSGMAALNFNDSAGLAEVYARTTPSPLNGADNPPPTQSESCSMVGDWELPGQVITTRTGTTTGPPTVFSFDAAGNVMFGGEDICDAPHFFGTYALSPGMFQLTSNSPGTCAWNFAAGYAAAFDATCDHVSLNPRYDDCTGGRIYFNAPSVLTRRPAGACCDAGAAAP